MYTCYTVFLFSILGIGVGPSELGKLARKLWELGKVELYKKYFKHKRILTIEVHCIMFKAQYDLVLCLYSIKRLKIFMFVVNFLTAVFQDFPIGNFYSAIGKKQYFLALGVGPNFSPKLR